MTRRKARSTELQQKAGHLQTHSKYKDAAALLEQALSGDLAESLYRYEAQMELAHCCIMLGRFPEAMAHLGEVYAATKGNPLLRYQSFWAYVQQIETLRCMQEAQGNETEANVGLRLRLIEDGLVWLRDSGLKKWRHAFFFQKGIALWALNKKEEALHTMELAYRLSRSCGGPGYSSGTYAWRVAMFSWGLGYVERGLEVLDKEDHEYAEPVVQIQMLVQRVRLLRLLAPTASSDALEVARKMIGLLTYSQHPRIEAFAYAEWAYSAIDLNSFDEALEAVKRLVKLALEDETLNRAFLMREAKKALSTVLGLLEGKRGNKVRRLMRLAQSRLKELDDQGVPRDAIAI
jgi:tetratricopeptide (TPR) repeat protein